MNIRVRKHNDRPDWIVAEWIVDGKVADDVVELAGPVGVTRACKQLIRDNYDEMDIDHEEGLDDL